MGYLNTANTITLTAKLTPFGRVAIATKTFPQITSFCLGDSDANYYASNSLTSGQVPAAAGTIGPDNSISNSVSQSSTIRSQLIYNGTGTLIKLVEQSSNVVSSEIIANGETTISGTDITHNVIDRNDFDTDSLVNLYYSFGLPLNSNEDITFTGRTYAQGGFSDTALSGLATTKIVVLGINNSKYGETIDGKQVNLILPTTGGTYNIYSTFQNAGLPTSILDNNIIETSIATKSIGSNIAFLFSDTIKKPNGNSTLSWSTGFGSIKPFSLNQKNTYNFQTESNLGLTADTIVGVAYLDKGFIVITDPTIVSDYGDINLTGATTGSSITLNSVSTSVFQNITCIAERGAFPGSTNRTFTGGDTPRITEVGLFDSVGNLLAIAKTDSQILKNINEFKAFGINITL